MARPRVAEVEGSTAPRAKLQALPGLAIESVKPAGKTFDEVHDRHPNLK
ncbi:MAG: hypothetical protein JO015_09390 [Verrucomicrobia bacterium]|nr:hypothetical protein [Verrucomicrobiota bacterium]